MTDSEALLPCPFCGGSASLSAWDVQCDSCGALVVPENGAQHEAGAIAAWNRRVSALGTAPAVKAEFDRDRFLQDDSNLPSRVSVSSPAPATAAEIRAEMTMDQQAHASALSDTDGAKPDFVLSAVLGCALRWEPDARIIGNVRAGDIVRAIRALS
jgi:hypothetical protein